MKCTRLIISVFFIAISVFLTSAYARNKEMLSGVNVAGCADIDKRNSEVLACRPRPVPV